MTVSIKKLSSGISVGGMFLLFLISGCATNLKQGYPPDIDRLKTLIPSESKAADVLLTLGEPRGYGKSRWASPSVPKKSEAFDVWEYEYTLADATDIEQTILILFFRGDVYKGYFWFSSQMDIKGIFSFLPFWMLIEGRFELVTFQIGDRPDTDVLENQLRVGETTQADVTQHLGKPFGRGSAMLPVQPEPRTIWSYYFKGGQMTDLRRTLLLIYFKEDRLDGYMWFSSLPE